MRRLLFALALLLTGCVSQLEGPQFTKLPPGLGYVPESRIETRKWMGLDWLSARFWVRPRSESCSASLVEYRGSLSHDQLEDARIEWLHLPKDSPKIADLPPFVHMKVDGHDAWGWWDGETGWRALTVFIDEGDRTYIAGISSTDPKLQADKDLTSVIESFRRDPNRLPNLLVPVVTLAIVAVAGLLWWTRRKGADPNLRPDGSQRAF
jgi:hypothetical protein